MCNLLLDGLPLSANTHRVTLPLSPPGLLFEGCGFDLAKGEQHGEALTHGGVFVETSIEDQLEAQRGGRRGLPVVAPLAFTPICMSQLSSAAAQR